MTLPRSFRVQLAPGVLKADGGHLLVGGTPLTAMRLSARAEELVRGDAGQVFGRPHGADDGRVQHPLGVLTGARGASSAVSLSLGSVPSVPTEIALTGVRAGPLVCPANISATSWRPNVVFAVNKATSTTSIAVMMTVIGTPTTSLAPRSSNS